MRRLPGARPIGYPLPVSRNCIALVAVLLCLRGEAVRPAIASELERLDGVTLVADPGNDGDSFKVRHEGTELLLRLYCVDCPETAALSSTDARRVRAQTRYFGLQGHDRTTHFGRLATAFVREQLSQPFTVNTAYATAPGRGSAKRCYAFVTTAAGRDLGSELVARGLARAYGIRRMLPDGTPAEEAGLRLADEELAAALGRRGIWADADADRLVALRAAERREEAELAQVSRDSVKPQPIDINSATPEELETIPGIGPVTAGRIIEHRPFKDSADLARVPNLSHRVLAELTSRVTFPGSPALPSH